MSLGLDVDPKVSPADTSSIILGQLEVTLFRIGPGTTYPPFRREHVPTEHEAKKWPSQVTKSLATTPALVIRSILGYEREPAVVGKTEDILSTFNIP